ncbi:MAG: hypothetical protein AAGN46_09715 [Acidobacteriota bacterium]
MSDSGRWASGSLEHDLLRWLCGELDPESSRAVERAIDTSPRAHLVASRLGRAWRALDELPRLPSRDLRDATSSPEGPNHSALASRFLRLALIVSLMAMLALLAPRACNATAPAAHGIRAPSPILDAAAMSSSRARKKPRVAGLSEENRRRMPSFAGSYGPPARRVQPPTSNSLNHDAREPWR